MSVAERKAALLAKREEQRLVEAAAHADQELTDLEALVDLEAVHGFDRVLRIDLKGWKPGAGAATLVAIRVPMKSESFFRRFESKVSKPKADTLAAMHELAEGCVVYPDREKQKDLYEATVELAPGVITMAADLIVKAVQGKADEEKKD